MNAYRSIAEAAAARHRIGIALEAHIKAAQSAETQLRAELKAACAAVSTASAGLDLAKIAEAESILEVRGKYATAGQDRASVLRDAVAQIATGEKCGYSDLWEVNFGTKDYSGWHGQRSDHTPFCGPRHGSIIFSIGLHQEVRNRAPRQLTDAERDACVYYLENLEAIQASREKAA